MKKTTFALYFGNRGFMPEKFLLEARRELTFALEKQGMDYIIMDETATRYGAVETREEGQIYAKWLEENKGKFDGIILSMPIFIDEIGAVTALKNANVPILMQAYPDEIGKMDFANRRDAYCGKFSVTDVFEQYKIPFTVLKPHVVHPLSDKFAENLRDFAAICRVVNGMKQFNMGCIGARTTAFKTVRYDELTAQRYGINIESLDLSELIFRVQKKSDDEQAVLDKLSSLIKYTNCSQVPAEKLSKLAKSAVVIDELIAEYNLDAITLRCWNEFESILGICPCVIISELNDRGIVASCEMDVCSAITMRAMNLASLEPTICLDWNNNYGEEVDKVILFHCGSAAQSLMVEKGNVTNHKMFDKTMKGSGWGSNEGRLKAFDMTYSNCRMEDGKIIIYFEEGLMTNDVIEDGYFGCAGVAKIENIEEVLCKLARNGFKHHTTIGKGHLKTVLDEAFRYYLGYDIVNIG